MRGSLRDDLPERSVATVAVGDYSIAAWVSIRTGA